MSYGVQRMSDSTMRIYGGNDGLDIHYRYDFVDFVKLQVLQEVGNALHPTNMKSLIHKVMSGVEKLEES